MRWARRIEKILMTRKMRFRGKRAVQSWYRAYLAGDAGDDVMSVMYFFFFFKIEISFLMEW